ncbi:hypothetical protein SAMN05892877_110259, partial [Rhizobium subbaraonis]
NLNTIIQIITLIGMCVGGVAIWVDKSRDIEELQAWRTSIEQDRKEKSAEYRANMAKLEERVKGTEKDIGKIDNLQYRLTVAEQSTATTATAMKELQDSLNDMNGDIRVMREILQRLDNVNGRRADKQSFAVPG